MGVTIFDLFGEILTSDDMKCLLIRNGISPENFEGARLVLRCFILLIDLGKVCDKIRSIKVESNERLEPTEVIKVEEVDTGYEEDQDNDLEMENSNEAPEATEVINSPKKLKISRRRSTKALNLCRGPGCNCAVSFGSREELQRHYVEKGCFTCKECQKRLPSKLQLREHLQREHNPEKDTGPPFKCRKPNCTEEFPDLDSRENHERMIGHYSCEPCGVRFNKSSELNEHYKSDSCKDLVCEVCGYDVRNGVPSGRRARILKHRKTCLTGHTQHMCDLCGKYLKNENTLKHHKEAVHSEFAQQKRDLFRANQMAHAELRRKNPRSFKCDQCDRCYTTNQKLKFHKLAQHAGEKQFQCHECHKSFTTPANLANHIRKIHNPELFVGHCDICGRGHTRERWVRECCHDKRLAKYQAQLAAQQKAVHDENQMESLQTMVINDVPSTQSTN